MAHIRQILANLSISISDFKKNPKSVIKAAKNEPIAVIIDNTPAFYCVPADILESLYQKFYEMNDMTLQNLQTLDSSGSHDDAIDDNDEDNSLGVNDVFQAIEDENDVKLNSLTHTDDLVDPLNTKVADPLDEEVAHQITRNLDTHFPSGAGSFVKEHATLLDSRLDHEVPSHHRRIEDKALLHEVIQDVHQSLQDQHDQHKDAIVGPHNYSLEHVAKVYSPYKAHQIHKAQKLSKKEKKKDKEHKYAKSLHRLQGEQEFTSQFFKETIHNTDLPPHTEVDEDQLILPLKHRTPDITLDQPLSIDTISDPLPEKEETLTLIEDSTSDTELEQIEKVADTVIEQAKAENEDNVEEELNEVKHCTKRLGLSSETDEDAQEKATPTQKRKTRAKKKVKPVEIEDDAYGTDVLDDDDEGGLLQGTISDEEAATLSDEPEAIPSEEEMKEVEAAAQALLNATPLYLDAAAEALLTSTPSYVEAPMVNPPEKKKRRTKRAPLSPVSTSDGSLEPEDSQTTPKKRIKIKMKDKETKSKS